MKFFQEFTNQAISDVISVCVCVLKLEVFFFNPELELLQTVWRCQSYLLRNFGTFWMNHSDIKFQFLQIGDVNETKTTSINLH